MPSLGMPELLVILGVVVLLFSGKNIREVGEGLGEGLRNFRDALSGGYALPGAQYPGRMRDTGASTGPSGLQALLSFSCPRCRRGPIFRGSLFHGWLNMYEKCPVCGLQYDREQGYFVGAMMVSYAISIPPIALLMWLFWLATHWAFPRLLIAGFLAYLPFVPGMVRLSRVLWIHMDRAFDPE